MPLYQEIQVVTLFQLLGQVSMVYRGSGPILYGPCLLLHLSFPLLGWGVFGGATEFQCHTRECHTVGWIASQA